MAAAADRPLFAVARSNPVVSPGVSIALAQAQDASGRVAVWVFFTDKDIRTQAQYRNALATVADGYNQRAVTRRSLRRSWPGLFDHYDLPVVSSYVDQAVSTGVRLRSRSAWLNAVSVEATIEQIEDLAKLPFVRLIKPLARAVRVVRPESTTSQRSDAAGEMSGASDFYGRSREQLELINIPAAHAAGPTGEGGLSAV
ncbi:MAG: hypothetical protein IID31_14030, partial [Planctomycetes bacterium]|nr:hypothetical protein [Planctomycetota bacterium]